MDCKKRLIMEKYVLVEFPEDAGYFEGNDIGYPCFNSEDNGARYVPEEDYINHFEREPHPNTYFKPIRWSESQSYMGSDDSVSALCEPVIADEKGLKDFGSSAIWVPLCLWKYPATLYDQWASSGALDELEKTDTEKTTVYSYTDSGDFVRCDNCDTSMLVPIGADKCPACHFEGGLVWADNNRQEATLSALEETGEFNITIKNEPEPVEYLSVEVLRDEYEMDTEEICRQIIHADRSCEKYEWEQYENERRSVFPQLDSTKKILQDFDTWKEQSDLEYEKIQDANYYSSL
jgi:hypothetical protein